MSDDPKPNPPPQSPQPQPQPPMPGFTSVEEIFSSFGDLFGDFFGQRAPAAGPDVRLGIRISEAIAAAGEKREVAYQFRIACTACAGRGSNDPEAVRLVCKGCGGSGKKQVTQGFFNVMTVCADCRGAKDRIANPCGACTGNGSMIAQGKLVVVVPPQIANGTTLRIPERGNADLEGNRGDLFVTVHVGELPAPNLDHMFAPAQPQIPRAVARDPRSARAAANERKQWILMFAAMFAVAVIGYLLLKR